eukprot:3318445-Heterocapsa_arctica.AAC.1
MREQRARTSALPERPLQQSQIYPQATPAQEAMRARVREITYGRSSTPTRRDQELLQEIQDTRAA